MVGSARSATHIVHFDGKDIKLFIQFSNKLNIGLYQKYLDKHISSFNWVKEDEFTFRKNFLQYVKLVMDLFVKQDMKDLVEYFFGNERDLFYSAFSQFLIIVDEIKDRNAAATFDLKSSDEELSVIYLNYEVFLNSYFLLKCGEKIKIKNLIKILSHEFLHYLDSKNLKKIKQETKEINLPGFLNLLFSKMRSEGLARIVEWKNSNFFYFDSNNIPDVYDLFTTSIEKPWEFNGIYDIHQEALYNYGAFYCIIDLLSLSRNLDKVTLISGKTTGNIKELNSFLKMKTFKIVGIPAQTFNSMNHLKNADLKTFIEFSYRNLDILRVERKFNILANSDYFHDLSKKIQPKLLTLLKHRLLGHFK